MREVGRPLRRVVGRQALERSVLALAVRTLRFSRYRATSPADRAWAGRVVDDLMQLAAKDLAKTVGVNAPMADGLAAIAVRAGTQPQALLEGR